MEENAQIKSMECLQDVVKKYYDDIEDIKIK